MVDSGGNRDETMKSMEQFERKKVLLEAGGRKDKATSWSMFLGETLSENWTRAHLLHRADCSIVNWTFKEEIY
jgi:hypothetical protein